MTEKRPYHVSAIIDDDLAAKVDALIPSLSVWWRQATRSDAARVLLMEAESSRVKLLSCSTGRSMTAKQRVTVRLDHDTIAKIDGLILSLSMPWRQATRSDAVRALLIAALEARSKTKPAPRKPRKRTQSASGKGGRSGRTESSPKRASSGRHTR